LSRESLWRFHQISYEWAFTSNGEINQNQVKKLNQNQEINQVTCNLFDGSTQIFQGQTFLKVIMNTDEL